MRLGHSGIRIANLATSHANMTSLSSSFQRFHTQIALDESRFKRIQSAHQALRQNVEADRPLSRVLKEVFLQGSYAQSTAVRPPDRGEFDVDVVLALDLNRPDYLLGLPERRGPTDTLDWVATRLRTVPAYEGKVRRRGRCVRIQFAGEFHLDVVPAHSANPAFGVLHIPNATQETWQESNPKAYMEWCRRVNERTSGQFVRVTKYLKWWRDHSVTQNARPKSIILQTMIGDSLVRTHQSDADAVVHSLNAIAIRMQPSSFWFGTPRISNPSMNGEDLAESWSRDAAIRFAEQVARAAKGAEQALTHRLDEVSLRLWRELFGDRFPAST